MNCLKCWIPIMMLTLYIFTNAGIARQDTFSNLKFMFFIDFRIIFFSFLFN